MAYFFKLGPPSREFDQIVLVVVVSINPLIVGFFLFCLLCLQ